MVLPTSGNIILSEIQEEFGGSNPASLSEYYRGGANVSDVPRHSAIPSSGTIGVSDFYGQQYLPPFSANIIFAGSVGNGTTIDLSSFMTTPTSHVVIALFYSAGTNQGGQRPAIADMNGVPMDSLQMEYSWARDDIYTARVCSAAAPAGSAASVVIGTNTTYAVAYEFVGLTDVASAVTDTAAVWDHTTGDVYISRPITVDTTSTSVVLATFIGGTASSSTFDVESDTGTFLSGLDLSPDVGTATYSGGNLLSMLIAIDKNLA